MTPEIRFESSMNLGGSKLIARGMADALRNPRFMRRGAIAFAQRNRWRWRLDELRKRVLNSPSRNGP